MSLDRRDFSLEDRVVAELDHKVLAEIELLPIEIQKSHPRADLAPVAEARLAAVEPRGRLHDEQLHEPLLQGVFVRAGDVDRRSGGL
ncbi:MAG: hypothetical protein HUU21_40385 [Polyangiaceae bacterium]|nr:hypothetical protein [Polyangiaceae bacterium]